MANTARLAAAFDRLERFIRRTMEEDNTPGVAVALTDRERLLWVAGYGFADLAARTPVAPGTRFEIGSIGKSFTGIALLQLHEAGRLDLHAPVADYLPWFAPRSRYGPITVHHLLSHTAGIVTGTDAATDARPEVWALRETEAGAPPGARFRYSNVGYKALGLVLEAIDGRGYGAAIGERILDPLGMRDTDPVITHETRKDLAVGYTPLYDDRPARPSHPLVPATWVETGTGDGSLAATPGDLAIYLRMLLNRGRGPRGPLLSDAGFARLTGRVIEAPGWMPGTFYGYGLTAREAGGHLYIGHPGTMVGYLAALTGDLTDGLGAVVFVNGPGSPSRIARYALRLLSAALHNEELPPLPPAPDPTRVEEAADYAGTYRAGGRTITLAAEGERLVLTDGAVRVALEGHRDDDTFHVDRPGWDRFVLRFGREAGRVVEAFHGPDWFVNERYSGPGSFDYPPGWAAYPGHYRSHNPWLTNFRVVPRKGRLVLVFPNGAEGFGVEEPLIPLGDGAFWIGEGAHLPERLRFDGVVDGQALRANLSGADYYRFFTP